MSGPVTWKEHGWRVRDKGAKTVDRFNGYLPNPKDHDLGYSLGLISTKHRSKKHARKLAYMMAAGDYAIGHSNGCFIIAEALWQGAQFRRIVLVNPALDRDFPLPSACMLEAALVVYCPKDMAVRAGKLVPWNSWGDAGAKGLRNNDSRVINWDYTATAKRHDLKTGHSKFWKSPQVYGPIIRDWFACENPHAFFRTEKEAKFNV